MAASTPSLDGGPTTVGVESTIVDVSTRRRRACCARAAWRPKPSKPSWACRWQRPRPARTGPQAAPGMLPVHYAPRTPLTLIAGDRRAGSG